MLSNPIFLILSSCLYNPALYHFNPTFLVFIFPSFPSILSRVYPRVFPIQLISCLFSYLFNPSFLMVILVSFNLTLRLSSPVYLEFIPLSFQSNLSRIRPVSFQSNLSRVYPHVFQIQHLSCLSS
ncbi:hypothetical protein CEXT_261621 [Caerostris extrusa]|uniref:Uncharacterized protein n=1 Tax=Caerostris extrusa TaxID=172846 RepID=A0AAV4V1W3_CAEEX|nr:hypothetical protein CEXT_261621 [Caerostris extrusa]